MSKSCCYSAALIVVIFLSASGLRINNFLQARIQILRSKVKTINWIAVLRTAQDTGDEFRRLRKAIKFDISAGYGSISSPIDPTDPDLDLLDVEVITRKSPVLWAHQVGRKYVQKVPDKALLGGLVLIASELLKRGVKNEKLILSPRVREIANMTSAELDSKLEMLSSLEWKVNPFLKGEYDNLQSQPLEVIDRFIVTSILPNVEKELTPFMNSMVGDTDKVKAAVKNLKDAIKGSMTMLEKTANENIQTLAPPVIALSLQNQTTSTIDSASSNIIDKVDSVGQGVEEAVDYWNKNVLRFSGFMKENLNSNSVINFVAQQLLINTETKKNIEEDFIVPVLYVDIDTNNGTILSNVAEENNSNNSS